MEYQIRDYTVSDERQLNALALAAFEQYAGTYDDWDGFKAKLSQMSTMAESAELMVAEMDSELVGAVAYIAPHVGKAQFFKPEWAVMRMLVVSTAARGKGIGRALTQQCLERARRDHAGTLALHTASIMQVALAMYLKMGFVFYAEAPEIHGVKYRVYTKLLQP